MGSTILRSPNLADGATARVVRLYEVHAFARGGLARGAAKREVQLHVTPKEARALKEKWGGDGAAYGFSPGALKRFADGGLTGYYKPDPQFPGADTPATPTLSMPDTSAFRKRNADPPDYYTYGEGPEHSFYSDNVVPSQPVFPHTDKPNPVAPSSSGGAGGLGSLVGLGSVLAGGASIAGAMGYDNALTQGAGALGKGLTGNYAGALKDGKALYNNLTGTGTSASTGSGAALAGAGGLGAASGATALGATAPVAADAALSNLGTVTAGQLFGTSGSAAAGAGAGSLGTTGGTGALTSGASGTAGASTGALAGSGLSTALPLAAIGWALADAFNKSGDAKSAGTSAILKQLTSTQGWKLADPRTQTYQLPDGRYIRADEHARAVSEAVRKGDTAGADAAWQEWMNSAKTPGGHARGGSFGGAGASGTYDGADTEDRHVRGPGTGRSDSIPAQLSDGEYVLTAEDVALLGDGSNEAGAKRLDGFRQQLRKHKGGALSRGKISPNAKTPMEYLRGTR